MPTNQETFDRVALHLLTQNARAEDDDGQCMYWDRDSGRQCAVGCLIPKDEYQKEFEGKVLFKCDPTHRIPTEPKVPSTVGQFMKDKGHDLGLLYEMQNIHDTGSVTSWKSKLLELGRKNNLLTTVIDTFVKEKN